MIGKPPLGNSRNLRCGDCFRRPSAAVKRETYSLARFAVRCCPEVVKPARFVRLRGALKSESVGDT